MPATINGIGTCFFGKKNRREYSGVCKHCKSQTNLADYETREWFVFLFIPLIPLGKKQIIGYCRRCRHFQWVSPAKWKTIQQQTIEESMNVIQDGSGDSETLTRKLWELHALNLSDDAKAMAEHIESLFPDDVETLLNLALFYEKEMQPSKCNVLAERALAVEPTARGARRAVAVHAMWDGNLSRARELLDFMLESFQFCDVPLMIDLARRFREHGDHEEAMDIYRKLAAFDPALGKDRTFRKQVQLAEMHFPDRETILPNHYFYYRPVFWILTFAVVLFAWLFLASVYRSNNRRLYVVNGFAEPAEVNIRGKDPFVIPANQWRETQAPEGDAEITVKGPGGIVEKVSMNIPGTFLGRFFDDDVYVLNTFGAAVVLYSKVPYMPKDRLKKRTPDSSMTVHTGVRRLHFKNVDYPFAPLPDEIDMGQDNIRYKTTVYMEPGNADEMLIGMYNRKNIPMNDVLSYAESHIQADPDNSRVVLLYTNIASAAGQVERCRNFLLPGLSVTPLRIDWHRCYQNASELIGLHDQILSEYKIRLRKNPNNPDNLYLVSRLADRFSERMSLIDQALKIDSGHRYVLRNKVYNCLSVGQPQQGLSAAKKAVENYPEDYDALSLLRKTRIACGRYRELEASAQGALQQAPMDYSIMEILLLSLVAQGKTDQAEQACQSYYERITRELPRDDAREVHLQLTSQLRIMEEKGHLVLGLITSMKDPANYASDAFGAALCVEEFNTAKNWYRKIPETGWIHDLLLSLTAPIDLEKNEWLKKACDKLEKGSHEERLAGQMLRSKNPPSFERLNDIPMDSFDKAVVALALTSRAPQKKFLDLVETLNCGRGCYQKFIRDQVSILRKRIPPPTTMPVEVPTTLPGS